MVSEHTRQLLLRLRFLLRIEKGSKAQLVWRDQSSLDIKTSSTFQDMFNVFTKAYI